MPAQPKPWAQVEDTELLQLLIDNIHCLEYPLPGRGTGYLKLQYFDERFAPNQDAVRETKRRFCEALTLFMQKHGRAKTKKRGRKAA